MLLDVPQRNRTPWVEVRALKLFSSLQLQSSFFVTALILVRGFSVTSQKEIQSLIDAIDGVIPKAGARLPWLPPSEVASQRRVLEQVRSYLVSLQENVEESSPTPGDQTSGQASAQQIASAVVQEINSLGANLIQPLQAEILALRQQREALVTEIRQLETHQHYYESLAQQQAKQQQIISEFLQVLLAPLQESLTQQVAQTLVNLEAKFLSTEEARVAEEQGVEPGFSGQRLTGTPLHPVQRLEQMRQLQAHSDRISIALDSTLQVVFEALQRNIHTYHESLSQGLEKMYGLGQQAEVMVTKLFNDLAPKSSTTNADTTQTTLQSGQPPLGANTASSTLHQDEVGRNFYSPETEPSAAGDEHRPPQKTVNGRSLPYPGMEWRSPQPQLVKPPSAKFGSRRVEENLNPENRDSLAGDENLGVEHIQKAEVNIHLKMDDYSVTTSPDMDFLPTQPQQSPDSADAAVALNPGANSPGELSSQGRGDELEWLYESIFGASATTVQVEPDQSASLQPMPPEDSAVDEEAGESTEEIEIIGALTDLFLETPPEESSMPSGIAATLERVQTPPEQSLPQHQEQQSEISEAEQFEDTYIPASPEEDLLATDRPLNNPDFKLWLAEDIIEQLSEDFSSFEAADTKDVEHQQQQQKTAPDSVSPPPAPSAAQSSPQPPTPEALGEVLVEDEDESNL